jgi:ElaB/YqjD/DUF883 family membrane-anchored ribosome-binding protein
MGTTDRGVAQTEGAAADLEGAGTPSGFEKVKNILADRLQDVAAAVGEKAADQDEQSGKARYEKHAAEWLDHSAERVRRFDPMQADAQVRAYVGRNPGRSLLIAGAVGLVIGAILRRR